MNNRTLLTLITIALLSVGIVGLTSCSSKKPTSPPRVTTVEPGTTAGRVGEFGGEVVMDTASITSTIVAVDHVQRLVVVRRADGGTNTWFATREALGFDQLKAGDRIRFSIAEQLAVSPGTNGVSTTGTSAVPADPALAAKLRARLPPSVLAINTEVMTLTFTGKIVALDDWNNIVTLRLSDGLTRKIHTSEYVNLADVNVGDSVSVRCTQAAALELDKPAP